MKSLIKKIIKFYSVSNKPKDIDFLVFISGQKCTLKCKDCANFSPYLGNKYAFYSAEKICNDFAELLKKVNSIQLLQIQGGEFFIHPDTDVILNFLVQQDKIKKIYIATNGTKIPLESTMEIIKNHNIQIRVSNYGSVNSALAEKFCNVMNEKNIEFNKYDFAGDESKWCNLGGIETPKHTKKETKKNFRICNFNECLTLENGFVSRCSRATVAHLYQNFKPNKRDLVNVQKCSTRDLNRFVEIKYPVKACYYCNGGHTPSIEPAIQMPAEELSKIK